MQVEIIINKYFLLNPKKIFGANPSFCFRKKRKKRTLYFRKMTSPSRRLGYSNNQLQSCQQVKRQFQAFGNHGLTETDYYFVNSLTDYYLLE